MQSTMQDDYPLTITAIFDHGRTVHGNSVIVTSQAEGVKRATFSTVADRIECLAAALHRLGIREGDPVGTFAFNTQEHLEAYFAVPAMGAVLHTVNIRLFPEQIAYVVSHAGDRVLVVDDSLVPVLANVVADLKTVEHILVVGSGDASALGREVLRYDEVLAAEQPGYPWPTVDERSAAAMCYTSGTTGNPKGVIYSHRSTYLHSFGICSGEALALSDRDCVLPVVPMFHANAWGLPYACWLTGSDLALPGRFTQPDRLAALIEDARVTLSAGVPTVWFDLLRYAEQHPVDLSSLRVVLCGGAAMPRALMEAYDEKLGVRMIQGWGLTETSPVAALAFPPKGIPPEQEVAWRVKTGRAFGGVELRLVGPDGRALPRDGQSVGEIEVRGPWVAAAYHGDPSPEKFHDGWLRTGDVGTLDERGYIQITDRAKDVIKSGGEWISTLELEALLVSHPAVAEVAVVAMPDERWGERPLVCVVLKAGQSARPEELRAHLEGKVPRWWMPEYWTFVDAVPRTSVGKFDKKVLRARQAAGELQVTHLAGQKEAAPA